MQITTDDLRAIRWDIAGRLYGNAHHTLIGLVSEWWTRKAPHAQVAEECARHDAVLFSEAIAHGVTEVERDWRDGEGQWALARRIRSIVRFLATNPQTQFGLVIAYASEPRGRGANRAFPDVPINEAASVALAALNELDDHQPPRRIGIATINKGYIPMEQMPPLLRQRAEYYRGLPSEVHGLVVIQGQPHIPEPEPLWPVPEVPGT